MQCFFCLFFHLLTFTCSRNVLGFHARFFSTSETLLHFNSSDLSSYLVWRKRILCPFARLLGRYLNTVKHFPEISASRKTRLLEPTFLVPAAIINKTTLQHPGPKIVTPCPEVSKMKILKEKGLSWFWRIMSYIIFK